MPHFFRYIAMGIRITACILTYSDIARIISVQCHLIITKREVGIKHGAAMCGGSLKRCLLDKAIIEVVTIIT